MSKKVVPVTMPGEELELNVGITKIPSQTEAKYLICFLSKHR